MIKQILKIIYVERKANSWILLELIIVFTILWFCSDYMYFTAKRYSEPNGFDIGHTYKINIETKNSKELILPSDNKEEEDKILEDLWTIHDRIKKYHPIEYVSLARAAYPYDGSWRSTIISIDSVKMNNVQTKDVSPGFFDVFKVSIIEGTPFDNKNTISDDVAIIGGDRNNLLDEKKVEDIKEVSLSSLDGGKTFKVIGIANKTKRSEFDDYNNIIYFPLERTDASVLWGKEICVRVKPNADKNFAEQFMKDMRAQLEVGDFYLSSVTSFKDIRESYLGWTGYEDNIKSIYSITIFLVINIFLGIIGTFWFRIQSRRSEIGLRLSLGSTKGQIKKMFICETLLLLFIASIIASVICVNISLGDILKDINVPIPNRRDALTDLTQHFINYSITFLFISFISLFAVWYPANKASKTQPAEVLKSE